MFELSTNVFLSRSSLLTCYSRRVGRTPSCCGAGSARPGHSRPDRYRSGSRPGASAALWLWTAASAPKTPWRYLTGRSRKEELWLQPLSLCWPVAVIAAALVMKRDWWVFALTGSQEVSLGVAVRVVPFLRREEEMHGAHLTHT